MGLRQWKQELISTATISGDVLKAASLPWQYCFYRSFLISVLSLKLLPLLRRQPRFHLLVRIEHDLLKSGNVFLLRKTGLPPYPFQQSNLLLHDWFELSLLVQSQVELSREVLHLGASFTSFPWATNSRADECACPQLTRPARFLRSRSANAIGPAPAPVA